MIDEKGEQVGIISLEKALAMAGERNLDLVQITDKVRPPICKILDHGKYLYQLKKKEGKSKAKKTGDIKGIRLSFGISEHDLETRARQTKSFFDKGYRVRIEMRLYGRQKGLTDFARKKIRRFVKKLGEEVPIKIEGELKREARGLTMIISKKF